MINDHSFLILQIVERNSRKPDFARSDLHALVAATRIAAKRVIDMCQRFGVKTYERALDQLLTRNKVAVSKLIAIAIPDEPISFEDYIDDDGHGVGPWRIAWFVHPAMNTRQFYSRLKHLAQCRRSRMQSKW